MPYVSPESRRRLASDAPPDTPGELNYAVSLLVDAYLRRRAEDAGRLRYTHINEAVGVLECAKLELYRRIAGPHEDGKMEENGDVYTVG
ncbi:MAG: hypothetical protein R3304_04890 [Longimicrobiales bacterium]|nr:hypothetical protein [Longimicrobiales bacterium]